MTVDVRFAADDTRIPGIVLLRGDAVAVLIRVISPVGKSYALLVQQARIPLGHLSALELPAGMLDGSSNFMGTAAQELKEGWLVLN
jgi:ADP-sugar diphosphatase